MPAAYYDFNVEQSSDFVSGLKILKPDTGQLFKFLPNPNQPFWVNGQPSFDVPNEIKLKYPNNSDSFGYLTVANAIPEPEAFLTIRMNIRGSGSGVITAKTAICKTASNTTPTYTVIKNPTEDSALTNVAFFDFFTNQENNILMTIPSRTTTQYKGRYLYDIELEYRIGNQNTPITNLSKFVIRLLQGRITFNPNITVST